MEAWYIWYPKQFDEVVYKLKVEDKSDNKDNDQHIFFDDAIFIGCSYAARSANWPSVLIKGYMHCLLFTAI
jgi:hypothetical protein